MLPSGISTISKTGVFNARRISGQLPAGYTLEQTAEKTVSGYIRDTFDGDVRWLNNVLVQSKGELHLIDLNSTQVLNQQNGAEWKFAAQLEAGDVRFQCLEISTLRAFMPDFKLVLRLHSWAVRDELQKMVTRLKSVTLEHEARAVNWVALIPLRGYEAEGRAVFQCLEESGYAAGSGDYVSMLGLKRARYESKPAIALEADADIVTTANTIVLTFLDVSRSNEKGTVDDIDTEFIHDYRVSLRRIRSLISLFNEVYSDAFSEEMKSQLADIMKQTNRLRDLDVYLQDRENYYELVPDNMYAGLDIMFGIFEKERTEALLQVKTLFQSLEYRTEMKRIQSRFQTLEKNARGNQASIKSKVYAKKTILKRYRKIAAIAKSIDEKTPDDTVHELRIQCKKLRYLMEFFAPFFPEKKIGNLIKSLKVLQDVLGRFNDYSVQQEALSEFVKIHPMRGKRGLKLAESVGALVATLYQLQKRARSEVEQRLVVFVTRKTAVKFEDLFSKG